MSFTTLRAVLMADRQEASADMKERLSKTKVSTSTCPNPSDRTANSIFTLTPQSRANRFLYKKSLESIAYQRVEAGGCLNDLYTM